MADDGWWVACEKGPPPVAQWHVPQGWAQTKKSVAPILRKLKFPFKMMLFITAKFGKIRKQSDGHRNLRWSIFPTGRLLIIAHDHSALFVNL